MISFETQPDRYYHWKLAFDGPVATLTLDVAEDKPLAPGYKLKLNSYDLGVDIELADALNRIRFEHPEVKSVVITSGKSRMFCSGANIYMLGHSSHASKVNFCKFTNETRNGIEDSAWNAWVGNMHRANELLGFLHGAYGLGATIGPLVATAMVTRVTSMRPTQTLLDSTCRPTTIRAPGATSCSSSRSRPIA